MAAPIIWYLHHYAGSPSLGMSYRPYYLSKEFNKNGCSAYVIGASAHHLLQSTITQQTRVNHQKIDNQDFIFLQTPDYEGNGIKRFINMFSYSWRLWRHHKEVAKITGKPSVIIVSSAHLFHYVPALLLAKKYKAKIIFEVRDLWPTSLIELLGVSSYHPMVLLIKCIEKLAYKNSDYVVSLLPHALPYMAQYGVTKERFVYISNGIDADELPNEHQPIPENYKQLIESKRAQGLFLIGYAGAHGEPNALDDLLNALVILKNDAYHKVHFFLVGNGNLKEKLQTFSHSHDLSSITFLEALPKNQVATFLDLMDVAYLGWKNKPFYSYGISPNKIFDYMLAAKPILHAFGALNDIVEQSKIGMTIEAENHAAIAQGIKKMAQQSPIELEAMGLRGRELVLSQFSYEYLGKKYMELF